LSFIGSHIKLEEHHVAVLHDIFFSFNAVLSRFLDFRLGSVFYDVVVRINFRLDKPFFKIRVNDAGGFWRGIA
jgi:hypothetical protein